MISIRIQEEMLHRVDEERERAGMSRAAAIIEALQLWVAKRQYEAAVREDQAGYARHPVTEEEFGPVLGAQTWPE
jgi:metal-responsive CopG/Arc/MetJ family transcriptional regulator